MDFQRDIVPETGSTNADLLARLAAGEALPEGYWLIAERQVGGRGRDGRPWISEPGNLYASTAIQLRPDDPPAPTLAFAIGLAVYRQVCDSLMIASRPSVRLKWPNDVLVNEAKVAGVLLERSGNAVVAGIGINIASAPQGIGRQTVCLAQLNSKYEAGPDYALRFLAPHVADEVARWRKDGVPHLLRRWQAAAHPVGTRLSVHDSSGTRINGTYDGLAADGALRLVLDDGTRRMIHAGDVTHEGQD